MRKRYTAQNLYKTTLVNPVNGISASGAGDTVFEILVNDTPSTELTEGFLVIDYNDTAKRDFIKFHNVSGSTFYYYRKDRDLLNNGSLGLRHDPGAYVQINVVMEYHEHLYDNLDDFGYIEDFWTNNFKVYGGIIDTPGGQATIADTSFTSVANGTWYVFFDYADNTFKLLASPIGYYGLSVATVVVASGDISTITDTRPMVMPVRYDSDVFQIGTDGELKLVNNTTISDATTISPGRVRLGTLTDHQSLTAGAVVVQTSSLVKTPDGTPANDENKVPILSSDGYIDNFVSFFGRHGYIGDSATGTDAYVVTPVPAIPTLVKGMRVSFGADVANTGTCSLNVGTGVVSIKTIDGNDPQDGAIKVNHIPVLEYNGTNWILQNPAQQEIFLNKESVFMDGFDGDVTISVNTTLTRDMYYNDLHIDSGIVLSPNGYKIHVNGTITGTGTIRRNGNNGGDGTNGTGSGGAAGVAGATLNQGTLNDAVAAGAGGAGVANANGTAGTVSAASTPSYSNKNGKNGGIGGTATGKTPGAAGVGGTTTRGAYYNVVITLEKLLSLLLNPASISFSYLDTFYGGRHKQAASGAGGGSGGSESGGANYSGGGGGGGTSGGTIWIAARVFNFTGTIESIGGNGGNGGTPRLGTGVQIGGSGGGGAGNGGVIYLMYKTKTSIGTTNVTGGTGGTGSTGDGGGGNGANGVSGEVGEVVEIQI